MFLSLKSFKKEKMTVCENWPILVRVPKMVLLTLSSTPRNHDYKLMLFEDISIWVRSKTLSQFSTKIHMHRNVTAFICAKRYINTHTHAQIFYPMVWPTFYLCVALIISTSIFYYHIFYAEFLKTYSFWKWNQILKKSLT